MNATSTDDDRISQLPEFIIHHILSFLDSPVDLLRISALSKNWFALTASFPILNFNIRKFSWSKQCFYKYVEYTTSRFCEQTVTTNHTFNLVACIDNPSDLDIIDNCLELILNKGVQHLSISVTNLPVMPVYRLPNLLVSAASSLTSLKIYSCGLPSSLMVDNLKFDSLKLFRLYDVHLDEEVIKRLTTCCPLLEEIHLLYCHGFKLICVHKHQRLREVIFCLVHRVERIDIEAPNLSSMYLSNSTNLETPLLNLASCTKLTTVFYCGVLPKATIFGDFLSSFSFIINLDLKLPKDRKNLNLSSSSLRTLVLSTECDLEEMNLDTPNLLLFAYTDRSKRPAQIDPSVSYSPRMECYPKNEVDALWFHKLRRFLGKTNFFKVLKLHISTKFMDIEELNMIDLPPYELEHVELEVETIKDISVYLDVVNGLLGCCRPRSLSLKSNFSVIDFKTRSQIVEFTYKMLLQQEDEGQTNIQIVLSPSSSSSKPEKDFSNLNLLLKTLTRDDQLIQTITLTKEEAKLEVAGGIQRDLEGDLTGCHKEKEYGHFIAKI